MRITKPKKTIGGVVWVRIHHSRKNWAQKGIFDQGLFIELYGNLARFRAGFFRLVSVKTGK